MGSMKHRRNALLTDQLHEAQQIIGKLGTDLAHAARHAVLRQQGVTQMQDGGHQCTEHLAIAHHAAKRGATDVHAVIGALARNQISALRLVARDVISKGDLDGGIDGLGA